MVAGEPAVRAEGTVCQAGGMTSATASRVRSGFASVAMVLIVLYAAIDVILQFLPPHYSVLSDAESDLAVAPFGWLMQVNFASRAVMSGCVVVAISLCPGRTALRSAGSVLIASAGLCSLALVFLATDVNRPGEFGMTPRSVIGTAHVVVATTGFIAILLGMLLLTPWLRGNIGGRSAPVLLAVAGSGLASLALSLLLFPQIVGLTERLCLVGILGWAFVVCDRIRTLNRAR